MPFRTKPSTRLLYDKKRIPQRWDPFDNALTFADSNLPILVSGGPGTGKRSLAFFIHGNSRPRGPFLTANLLGLSSAEQGALLFGDSQTTGLLDLANGGTLYLDEATSLTLPVQQRLNSLLRFGAYAKWPHGAQLSSQARLVAGTESSIAELKSSPSFCGSFLYNLGRVHIRMPPAHFLTESTLDLLATRWLEEVVAKKVPIAASFWSRLHTVKAEANLHELRALVQRSFLLARNRVENPANLAPQLALEEQDLDEAMNSGLCASEEYRVLEAFETALKRDPELSQTKLAHHHPDGMTGTDVVRLFRNRSGPKESTSPTRLGIFLDLWKAEFPALRLWLRSQRPKGRTRGPDRNASPAHKPVSLAT